jgi:hypothetical protein
MMKVQHQTFKGDTIQDLNDRIAGFLQVCLTSKYEIIALLAVGPVHVSVFYKVK